MISSYRNFTAQKMKISIKDFFSKYDQIRGFLRVWSHLLMKSLLENFIFCAVFKAGNIFIIFLQIVLISDIQNA